ncbi:putative UDP-Glycosyltransferase superfamily protein [Tripterygium wilfordii]|uniref:Putative UDP-Glycosyltransferase superfamily protein n=1 Tax=Tripterygium wilfordii TaxID=458696 RepID=A0A7J7DUE3_TRIWF|nr:UDP-glycosyltransferase 91A1-like [Tripterygium wilfordii]KAF5749784.1 putative UDP-Glycosyltransferase superfamily protein [Tripterygium wilfordii]
MAAENGKLHLAMFPWLAFGHMLPFLEFSKLVAEKGHKVSFISTPRNIDRLPKLPPHLSPLIDFVALPLPHLKNLPETAEATVDLPPDGVGYLKNAYDLLQKPLTDFLITHKPDWIIYDYVPYWLPAIAKKVDIPTVYFSPFLAATICCVCPALGDDDYRKTPEDYTVLPKWVPFPSTAASPRFMAIKLTDAIVGDESRSRLSEYYRFRGSIRGADIISIRTHIEFEPEWLKLAEDLHKKPVIPVGFIAPLDDDSVDETETWGWIKEWLDKQERGSIVYVAFGTEAKLSQDELTEIALGLELSGLPFFWVLRTHRGSFDPDPLHLPDGFLERTKAQGVVCTSWVPQLKILGHDSIGGYLTHSGWSSVIEALKFGKALVLLSFFADQGRNAKVLEEKKIGYPIPRNNDDGSFTRNSVAESLSLVMLEEEGKVYKEKAKEMSNLFGDKEKQSLCMDNFLDHLKANKRHH